MTTQQICDANLCNNVWRGENSKCCNPNPYPSGPYSVQSVGAAKAVSWAFGHNPGYSNPEHNRVATPTQDTRMAQSSQQADTHFSSLGKMTGWVNPPSLTSMKIPFFSSIVPLLLYSWFLFVRQLDLSIHWDHPLYKASVLPPSSLLGYWAQSWTGHHSDAGYSNGSIIPASW